MNIQELSNKIKKPVFQDMAIPILVILVGFGSFGLGRMSALETAKEPVTISQTAAVGAPTLGEGGKVVGSKTGNKYHFPWCPGASKISEQNKVWFTDEKEARAAGYLPAGNCKGLE